MKTEDAIVVEHQSIIGGYSGARLAQRVGRDLVRRAVVAIGIAATVFLLVWRQ